MTHSSQFEVTDSLTLNQLLLSADPLVGLSTLMYAPVPFEGLLSVL
jgi:hypothetical protein